MTSRKLYFKNIYMVARLINKVYLRGKGKRVFNYYINIKRVTALENTNISLQAEVEQLKQK